MSGPKVALCLGGGGVTGAMYQIGALAALEDAVEGLQANDFELYMGASSGATGYPFWHRIAPTTTKCYSPVARWAPS